MFISLRSAGVSDLDPTHQDSKNRGWACQVSTGKVSTGKASVASPEFRRARMWLPHYAPELPVRSRVLSSLRVMKAWSSTSSSGASCMCILSSDTNSVQNGR